MLVLKYLKIHNEYRCITQNINRYKRYLSSVTKVSTISEVYSLEQSGQVQIEGWIIGIRKMKSLVFLDVTDGSSAKTLQVTIDKNNAPNGLSFGASVAAIGALHKNKNNQLEVLVNDVKVLGRCNFEDGYPFAHRSKYNSNHEREFLHLRPRTHSFSSLLRIRHKCELILNNLLDENGYFNVDVPVLTTNDCEGGGEVFVVKPDNEKLVKEMKAEVKGDVSKKDEEIYFNSKTFLSVSGQLHLEVAARSLRKVYSLGPIFRAENSKSRLHLSEFYMLEIETAFIKDITDITVMLERLLKDLIKRILDECSAEVHSYLKSTQVDSNQQLDILNRITNEKFQMMTYDNAFDILDRRRDNFKSCPRKGETFGKEHELFLVDYNNKTPVFIVDWPTTTKPFYMKGIEGSSSHVEAMDLLCGNVGELCGGGVREDNYDQLKKKIQLANSGTKLDWYLDLRKYGNVTTGGFGMGFERFLQLLLGTANIKDTIPFPRWPHNCKL